MERIARTGAVKVQRRNSNFFKPIFLDFTYSVFLPPIIVLTALHWCFFPGSFLIIFGSEPKPKTQPYYHRFAGKFAWPDQVLGISYPFCALAVAASCPNCPPRTGATFNLISSLKFHPPTSPIIFSLLQFPNQRTKF